MIDRNSLTENQDAVDLAAVRATRLTAELFKVAGIEVADSSEHVTNSVRPSESNAIANFGANTRSKAFFEAAISAEWRKNVVGIIQTGRLLNEAKEELDRDVFGALKLPFEVRVSQMLRRIAEHPILAEKTNHGSLPACWRTLYELTKLDDNLLKAALTDGRIHAGLQRNEIRSKVQLLAPREKTPTKPIEGAVADLTPQQLRCGIEKLGPLRFRREVLPEHWVASQTNTALSLAKPEQLIATLERQISSSNKPARKALRELKKAVVES